MNDQVAREFNDWVDRVLSQHPLDVAAYNFNLYEHDRAFAIQLIGAARFDSDDPSWACDEVFSSGEDLFEVPREVAGTDWQNGLAAAKQLIENYVRLGARSERLRVARGVGVGFVDGDLDIVMTHGVYTVC